MGIVGRTRKTQTPMSSAKWKTEKRTSPMSSVKCIEKIPSHRTSRWPLQTLGSSHMKKDTVWVYICVYASYTHVAVATCAWHEALVQPLAIYAFWKSYLICFYCLKMVVNVIWIISMWQWRFWCNPSPVFLSNFLRHWNILKHMFCGSSWTDVSWMSFGCPFGCLLGVFWMSLGCLLDILGMSFGCLLGGFWMSFGCLLDVFWVLLGCLLGVFWMPFGCLLEDRTSEYMCKILIC